VCNSALHQLSKKHCLERGGGEEGLKRGMDSDRGAREAKKKRQIKNFGKLTTKSKRER